MYDFAILSCQGSIFPCDNVVRTDLVEVKMCKEIMADKTKDEAVLRVERGLYWNNGTKPIPGLMGHGQLVLNQ